MKKIRERAGCDICKEDDAIIDGKMKVGPWAFMCKDCFRLYGIGFGVGRGQLIQVEEKEYVQRKIL